MKSSSSLLPLRPLACLPLQLLAAQGWEREVTGLTKLLPPGCHHHSLERRPRVGTWGNLITTHRGHTLKSLAVHLPGPITGRESGPWDHVSGGDSSQTEVPPMMAPHMPFLPPRSLL